MAATAGVKVSAHISAPSGNKKNNIVRLGMRRDMVAPIWEGITPIPDEITKAGTGQIVVTAIMLHAVKILADRIEAIMNGKLSPRDSRSVAHQFS